MTDDLEFRNDPDLVLSATGNPVRLCPNKFNALMRCAAFIRLEATSTGHGQAANLVVLLDRLGITPDFKPDCT